MKISIPLGSRDRVEVAPSVTVLKKGRRELAKVMGFITVFAVWRLGPWRGGLAPATRVRVWAAATVMLVCRVMGGHRVRGPWGGAYALL